MGRGNAPVDEVTYVGFFDGKFTIRYDSPVPGLTVTRTNKNGNEVHEEVFNQLGGYLRLVEIKESQNQQYPNQWLFHIHSPENGTEKHYIFQESIHSSNARSILNVLSSLPKDYLPENPIMLMSYKYQPPDAKEAYTGITAYIKNGDLTEKVERAYRVKNADGSKGNLIGPKELIVNGKPVNDYTEQLAFLVQKAREAQPALGFTKRQVKALSTGATVHQLEAAEEVVSEPDPFDTVSTTGRTVSAQPAQSNDYQSDDDLPF